MKIEWLRGARTSLRMFVSITAWLCANEHNDGYQIRIQFSVAVRDKISMRVDKLSLDE